MGMTKAELEHLMKCQRCGHALASHDWKGEGQCTPCWLQVYRGVRAYKDACRAFQLPEVEPKKEGAA